MELENTTISLYPNMVPCFVDGALNQLYQRMHSSFAYHDISGNLTSDTHTYVARRNGEIVVLLLFFIENKTVRVLNEQFTLEAQEVDRFCTAIFTRYPHINLVSFPVIENRISLLSFPFQQNLCTQDIVLTLPDAKDTYFNSLGKSTRNYIKRYMSKLKRDFPSMTCKTYCTSDVNEEHVRAIIALNRSRMAIRYQASSIDETETEKILKLARRCGMVTVVTINGQVCAGAINYRFGENYFLKVIAHDPAYDEYGLGTLCCYLAICECIARGGREYHFMWGRYEYKYRLLGKQRDLSHLAIYRSRAELLRHGRAALTLAYQGYAYKARDWMELKMRRQDNSSISGRLAFHGLNGLKKLKRAIARLRTSKDRTTAKPVSVPKES